MPQKPTGLRESIFYIKFVTSQKCKAEGLRTACKDLVLINWVEKPNLKTFKLWRIFPKLRLIRHNPIRLVCNWLIWHRSLFNKMPNEEHTLGLEKYWNQALKISKTATESGSLVPLETQIIKTYNNNEQTFELRKLISKKPLHLFKQSKKINPFLPWDKNLEISKIEDHHILLLNKFPVEIGHMLLITNSWAPQNGWLTLQDWKALDLVNKDTSGLWFFNSSSEAGASQPHRHFQLLRRSIHAKFCPREVWFQRFLDGQLSNESDINKSSYITDIDQSRLEENYLYCKYLEACENLRIGSPRYNPNPLTPYNLILTNQWLFITRRSRDNLNGFSINALGFAGYLLATEFSNLDWLESNGPEHLLEKVVNPLI